MQKLALLQGLKRKWKKRDKNLQKASGRRGRAEGELLMWSKLLKQKYFWGYWRPWSNAKQHIWLWQRTRADGETFFFFGRVCFVLVCAWDRRRDGQSCEAGRNGQNWWCSPLRIWVRCSLFTLVLLAPVTDLLSLCQVTERGKQRKPEHFTLREDKDKVVALCPRQTKPFPFCAICG